MSEYLSKKAVLEWLNENIKDQDWPYEIRYAFKHVREKIQSGAFDANGEVQRLRASLGHIHAIAQSEFDDLQYEGQRKTWEEILLTAEEALKGDGNDA